MQSIYLQNPLSPPQFREATRPLSNFLGLVNKTRSNRIRGLRWPQTAKCIGLFASAYFLDFVGLSLERSALLQGERGGGGGGLGEGSPAFNHSSNYSPEAVLPNYLWGATGPPCFFHRRSPFSPSPPPPLSPFRSASVSFWSTGRD